MIAELLSSTQGILDIIPGLPESYKGPFIRGSRSFHHSSDLGVLSAQLFEGKRFSLQLLALNFRVKMNLHFRLQAGLQSIYLQKGEIARQAIDGVKTALKESQFLLIQGKQREWQLETKAKRSIHFLLVSYTSDLAEEIAAAYPALESFLKGEVPAVKGAFSAQGGIRVAVHDILQAQYGPEQLPYYFKNRVEDYIFHLLDKATLKDKLAAEPTGWEREAVYRVRELILKDILQHHSIDELAKKVKMNEARLKKFFKAEFEVGPYEFLLRARLDKVKQLLDEGVPMKVAAPMSGYSTTSFITAYRKRFGRTPGKDVNLR